MRLLAPSPVFRSAFGKGHRSAFVLVFREHVNGYIMYGTVGWRLPGRGEIQELEAFEVAHELLCRNNFRARGILDLVVCVTLIEGWYWMRT